MRCPPVVREAIGSHQPASDALGSTMFSPNALIGAPSLTFTPDGPTRILIIQRNAIGKAAPFKLQKTEHHRGLW